MSYGFRTDHTTYIRELHATLDTYSTQLNTTKNPEEIQAIAEQAVEIVKESLRVKDIYYVSNLGDSLPPRGEARKACEELQLRYDRFEKMSAPQDEARLNKYVLEEKAMRKSALKQLRGIRGFFNSYEIKNYLLDQIGSGKSSEKWVKEQFLRDLPDYVKTPFLQKYPEFSNKTPLALEQYLYETCLDNYMHSLKNEDKQNAERFKQMLPDFFIEKVKEEYLKKLETAEGTPRDIKLAVLEGLKSEFKQHAKQYFEALKTFGENFNRAIEANNIKECQKIAQKLAQTLSTLFQKKNNQDYSDSENIGSDPADIVYPIKYLTPNSSLTIDCVLCAYAPTLFKKNIQLELEKKKQQALSSYNSFEGWRGVGFYCGKVSTNSYHLFQIKQKFGRLGSSTEDNLRAIEFLQMALYDDLIFFANKEATPHSGCKNPTEEVTKILNQLPTSIRESIGKVDLVKGKNAFIKNVNQQREAYKAIVRETNEEIQKLAKKIASLENKEEVSELVAKKMPTICSKWGVYCPVLEMNRDYPLDKFALAISGYPFSQYLDFSSTIAEENLKQAEAASSKKPDSTKEKPKTEGTKEKSADKKADTTEPVKDKPTEASKGKKADKKADTTKPAGMKAEGATTSEKVEAKPKAVFLTWETVREHVESFACTYNDGSPKEVFQQLPPYIQQKIKADFPKATKQVDLAIGLVKYNLAAQYEAFITFAKEHDTLSNEEVEGIYQTFPYQHLVKSGLEKLAAEGSSSAKGMLKTKAWKGSVIARALEKSRSKFKEKMETTQKEIKTFADTYAHGKHDKTLTTSDLACARVHQITHDLMKKIIPIWTDINASEVPMIKTKSALNSYKEAYPIINQLEFSRLIEVYFFKKTLQERGLY